jgi:hypothetical protein
MTAAFNEFMRQHTMTGSEKADGYSRNAFVGLDEGEKEEVFRLLVEELPYSVEWLFFVDPRRSLEVVKKVEADFRGRPFTPVFLLQEELIAHTKDMAYQEHLIEDYLRYDGTMRPRVVDAVGRTPTSAASIGFFRQVILTESNDTAVARAARGLLDALNVPYTTEPDKKTYQRLISELRSKYVDEKLRALNELAKFEAAVLKGL